MVHEWRAYVAGPENFLVEGPQIEVRKERLCDTYALECLGSNKSDKQQAAGSSDFGVAYAKCMALMLRADFGVFNLTPVAGSTPDVDTIFRLGMIIALGKPVYAYVNYAIDPEQSPNSINNMIEKSLVSSYFAMQNRRIVVHVVSAKDIFNDLAGFEECLRTAKNDLLHSSGDNSTYTEFI